MIERYPFKPLFSASAIDAIMRCPGAATLPIVEICTDESLALSTQAKGAGTAEHAEVLTWESLPANLRHWLLDGWNGAPNTAIIFEQRFAVSFDALLSAPVDKVNPHALGLSAGTPDAFAYWFDSQGLHLRVGDLKTGAGQGRGCLPHPSQSWQLRYYALAVLLWLGWSPFPVAGSEVGHVLASVKVSFWTRDYVAEREAEPDLDPTDRAHLWRITEAPLDEQTLRESVTKLQELTKQLSYAPQNVWRVGDWCGGCRSLMACPVHKNAIERLGTATDGELDDAKVAEAYEALDVVRAQVAAAERSVEAYVTSKGLLPLRGDRTLTRVARKGRRVSPLALPMLKEKFPAEYPAMVRESTSLARIAQAVGEAVPGPRTAMVLGELEGTPGALVKSEGYELRVRRNGSD